MRPVIFDIPLPFFGWHLPIYGYGLMLVIGFLGGLQLAKFLARRSGLDPELFANMAMLALVSGIVGARPLHVLENLDEFTDPRKTVGQNLWNVVNLRSGGLTYYGGLLLAAPVCVIYALKKKLPLLLTMDIVAPVIMIGLGVGRVGCFLNGCCHDARCDLPAISVRFPYHSGPYQHQFDTGELKPPGQLVILGKNRPRLLSPAEAHERGLDSLVESSRSLPVNPAQLLSTVTALLLAGMLVAYYTMPRRAGRGFALMMMLEGTTRFILELLRVQPAQVGTFSLSMFIGVMLVLGGIAIWVLFGRVGSRVVPSIRPAAGNS